MPELQVRLGVSEAKALAEWLETASDDYQRAAESEAPLDPMSDHGYFIGRSTEAREWAALVKPKPIGGRNATE